MSAPTHNLDIQSYSFYDIIELFDLSPDNVSLEDLKRAKKRVLMLHPDKSKLPKEYFLFYKKAFIFIFYILVTRRYYQRLFLALPVWSLLRLL